MDLVIMKRFIFLFLIFFVGQNATQAQTIGLFFNDADAYNGYTLIAPSSNKMTYLIDNCGELINSWESDYFPGASAYLLENGNLLRAARIQSDFQGGGTGGRIEIFNWEGDLIWGYDYSTADYHQHHDIAYMPNGNILVLAWDKRSAAAMIQAGRNPVNASADHIWSEKIAEIQPIGTDSATVIWEWFLYDHLVQDFDSTKNNFGVVEDHPELLDINFGPPMTALLGIDWIHFNSINYNPQLDQIILSSRHLNEIMIIDHSTTTEEASSHEGGNSGKGGDLLFRWGNPQSYDRGNSEDVKLFGQHDAQWIPEGLPDEGKIILFNNGPGRPDGTYSTVDVIDPPIDSDGNYIIEAGQPFGPNFLYWSYFANPPASFFSGNISGTQRLPNGNTLICEGRTGRIFEVNNTGDILWQYVNPVGSSGPAPQGTMLTTNSVFRAYRYGEDYPAFEGKDLTPLGPLELNPTPSNCVITDIETPINNNTITILSNPVQDFLTIKNQNLELLQIDIFDLTGQLLSSQRSADQLVEKNIVDWKNGIYFVRIFMVEKNKFFTKKIIKQN